MRRRVVVPAVGAAAVALASVLNEHAAVLVHRCIAADGVTGWLGVRLALLRHGDCPEGALAVGGDGEQLLTLVVGAAVPVLIAHLVGVALGLGVAEHARRALRALRHLMGSRRLPGLVRVLAFRSRAAVGATARPHAWAGSPGVMLRAPPVPA